MARIKRRRSKHRFAKDWKVLESDLPEVVQLWLLRFLTQSDAKRKFYTEFEDDGDDIVGPLGLQIGDGTQNGALLAFKWLKQRLVHLERNKPVVDGALANNVETIGSQVGLNETEKTVLAFAALTESIDAIEDVIEEFGTVRSSEVPNLLSIMLDMDKNLVR